MSDLPKWASNHRNKWEYRGQKRPSFALKPKKGQESVWDYPRPPVLSPDNRKVLVKLDGHIIAKTTKAIRILETASPPTFYIPPEDVLMKYLIKTNKNSRCEWKGEAVYYDLFTKNEEVKNAAWSYPDPFDEYKGIAKYVSFYPGKVQCYVNGERVKPQPGWFYGGWITSEIVGPVKGEGNLTYL